MDKNVLSGIEPEGVMKNFELLSAIPRGSGKTQAASAFCIDFAKQHSLEYYTDALGDVVIYKNGSAGRENEEPVIVQGHLDMVWEKEEGSDFDFETQGLKLAVDGDWINACGTTLGGDDGAAVAMALALLEDETISHPPIEAVFTVDEETGMYGAEALDMSVLRGRRLLNIDSEEEGTLLVSCAGGARTDVTLEGTLIPCEDSTYCITLSGLHGGHSGTEINKGYAGANKLMGEILTRLLENNEFRIVSVNGGTMDNAITRECRCVISAPSQQNLASDTELLRIALADRFENTEKSLSLTISPCDKAEKCFDDASTKNIAGLLDSLPHGVIAMSKNVEGLVETSLNLGVLRTEGSTVKCGFAVRSSVNSEKQKLIERVGKIASDFGASAETCSEYPAWEFVENSPLQKTMAEVYEEMYGTKLNISAIHAGVECGLFCGKLPGLDCVSFGPEILDIHTPSERLSISSTQRVWKYLLKVLERL